MKRAVLWIVALLVIAGLVFWRVSARAGMDDRAREQVAALLPSLPDYAENGTYYRQLLDTHHTHAFDASMSLTSFDGTGYLDHVFADMAADAKAAGRTDQARFLTELRPLVTWE